MSRMALLGQILCTIICLTGVYTQAKTASFKGKEFIRYSIRSHGDSRKDKVTLRFKTTEAYGVLLYSCGRQGDFLLLELKRGKLIYTGDFGSTSEQSGVHQIMLNNQYNNNIWHDVWLVRENGTHVYLNIDGRRKSYTAHMNFRQLNLDNFLFVGGMSKSARDDGTCQIDNTRKKNYIGCLSNVRFNSRDILYGAYEGFDTFKTFGDQSFTCLENDFEILGFQSENSLLGVSRNLINMNASSYLVELRTFEPTGHVMTHQCTGGSIYIALIDGKIHLQISFLAHVSAVSINSSVAVNDGDWHRVSVTVKRNENSVTLKVDHDDTTYRFPREFQLRFELGMFNKEVRFGGSTYNSVAGQLPGLVTCFRSLVVDGKAIRFNSSDVTIRKNMNNVCQIRDLCFPNPCLHGSACSQSRQVMTCHCKQSGYHGKFCQACIYKRTCAEIWESGERKSGHYKICPNNERIFTAYCDMRIRATVIGHNIPNNTMIDAGYTIRMSLNSLYMHEVEYNADSGDIVDLLKQSPQCRQYIRYDCKKSYLLFDLADQRHIHYKGVRWLSRDSVVQNYWGGSTHDARTCACGMDASCARKTGMARFCNCDTGDSKWRFDAGFITDKSVLPVSAIQISRGRETNEKADEKAFFSLGRLECFGMYPRPTIKTTSPPTTPTKKPKATLIHPFTISLRVPPVMMDDNGDIDGKVVPEHEGNGTVVEITGDGVPFERSRQVANETISSDDDDHIIWKPWLIIVVAIVSLLFLLFIFVPLILSRQQTSLYNLFMKCVYGKHINKPRVEIEDYNRYSTATEESSDWDVHRISTTFPTSTPEPSYGPTDDESTNMRVRTLEDVRGKRRFKRLHGWSSQTASAPTVVGADSKPSFSDISNHFYISDTSDHSKNNSKRMYDSRTNQCYQDGESTAGTAYSTTATDGGVGSLAENSEYSHKSSHLSTESSLKESEYASTPCRNISETEEGTPSHTINSDQGISPPLRRPPHNKPFVPPHGGPVFTDPVKAYYPVLPINGFREPSIRRTVPVAHPAAYGNHVTMLNNSGGNFALVNGSVARIVPVASKRSPESTPLLIHPLPHTITEREEDIMNTNNLVYENSHNINGFYGSADYDSQNSETRLVFGDANSREVCSREADKQIQLLKRKVIEKATSADDSM